jgi:uncharacterized protein (DUF4415 family)
MQAADTFVWSEAANGRARRGLSNHSAIKTGGQMAGDRKFRSSDPRQAAEAAFKAATTKPVEPLPKPPAIPGAKELVSLRIDRDVLDHFQEAGPGWQERINEALRKVAGK